MSQNVEIARRVYERINQGDVEGVLALLSEDFEFRDLPGVPDSGVYLGQDAFRRWYSGISDAFDDLRFEPGEMIESGDHVVVVTHAVGQGKGSGAAVEMDFSGVWTFRDGAPISLIIYSDHAEALAAAGVPE